MINFCAKKFCFDIRLDDNKYTKEEEKY
jgi:hypothetical protein